jgi:hypothetical protein
VCYEPERPGELLHVNTKKLARFWEIGKRIRRDGIRCSRRAGWQCLHVAIDDHSVSPTARSYSGGMRRRLDPPAALVAKAHRSAVGVALPAHSHALSAAA